MPPGLTPTADALLPVQQEGTFCKPRRGGLWTSTFIDRERISGWVEWCRNESFEDSGQECWLLEPAADARVAEIDTHDDLVHFHRLYGRSKTWGEEDRFTDFYLDYTLMAEAYDALHLTDFGQWDTRMTEPYNLYGWDCESTLWFRWAFTSVESLGVVALHGREDANR